MSDAHGLIVEGVSVAYGKHQALDNVSLTVEPGEVVVILGANGAGKSTLLSTIAGLVPRQGGRVSMNNRSLSDLGAHRVVASGLALVPEGRGIFGDLTVEENLTLGAYSRRAREQEAQQRERVYRLFPKLIERRRQIARTMSGGEQQMVAIGRAMMSAPDILMLDEPSLGLSPLLASEVFKTLKKVRETGLGILLVEQNAKQSLAIADRGYLLETGRITAGDRAQNLLNDPAVREAYLGGAGSKESPHPTHAPPAPEPEVPVAAAAMSAHPDRLKPAGLDRGGASGIGDADIHRWVGRAEAIQKQAWRTGRTPEQSPDARSPEVSSMPVASGGSLDDLLSGFEQAARRASTSPIDSPDAAGSRRDRSHNSEV